MAKRPRRRTTLPAHDPRAIQENLRHDLYRRARGKSILNDIEFVSRPHPDYADRFQIAPVIDGIVIPDRIDHEWLSEHAQAFHFQGLTDTDGRRRAPITYGPVPGYDCCIESVDITVAGRYVEWTLPPRFAMKPQIFDRALYRERLAGALADSYRRESEERRVRREFLQRTPWSGPAEFGLSGAWVCRLAGNKVAIGMEDLLWHCQVFVIVGKTGESTEAALERATWLIAGWDVTALEAVWSGSVRPPRFPPHWVDIKSTLSPTGGTGSVLVAQGMSRL